MAPVTWSKTARIAAAPDEVFAWMSDLREDDHARPAYLRGAGVKKTGRSKRTVLSRDGDVLRVRDEWNGRRYDLEVTLDRARREVRLAGRMGYSSTWRAAPDGTGTLLEATTTMAPGGLMGLLVPLFAKGFAKEMDQDFAGHVADLEDALVAKPPAR